MPDERYERGMAIRRRVLGAAHVERAEAGKTEFDAEFQRYISESAWGAVWAGEGLDLATRSLVTLAILASLGHWEEFQMHVRATRNTGANAEAIKAMLLHVAVYAGVPAANRAFALAKATLAEGGGGKQEERG